MHMDDSLNVPAVKGAPVLNHRFPAFQPKANRTKTLTRPDKGMIRQTAGIKTIFKICISTNISLQPLRSLSSNEFKGAGSRATYISSST